MAEIIPCLNKQTLSKMTSGEKRVARRLESALEDDYLVWYDIPVGKKRRYPDFIILHPSRGLLFIEVKDWKIETVESISKKSVTLLTDKGLTICAHPLEQARQFTYNVLPSLEADTLLCQTSDVYKGKLIMPYGWGVVFSNITRRQIESSLSEDERELLLPDHLIIYKDDLSESDDPEKFQERLWGMFHYKFGELLTLPQIDRIRWHLFPEVRINMPTQSDMFESDDISVVQSIPEMIKILDIQQEQLARSMGDGHRIIHGVAGSGKTMILGYRCVYLANTINKPILVLCFNTALAAKLRTFLISKGIGEQIQVYHFHDWCGLQIKTYHVDVINSIKPYWERSVETVIAAVDCGKIPRNQYGAVLIDEGHDFEADWLKLIVQMIDSETNTLLLLYDDAQSIYKKQSGLGFTLSSVGIQAKGRTTILRLNYRNSREILHFAYTFAQHYFDPRNSDEDHIPLIEPEAAGNSGPLPVIKTFKQFTEEINYATNCLTAWHKQGINWNDMAILYTQKNQAFDISKKLEGTGIPYSWLADKKNKMSYNSTENKVTVLTIHSSKGLEFGHVIIVGIGQMKDNDAHALNNARLLYVGMTRAQQCLHVISSAENKFIQQMRSA